MLQLLLIPILGLAPGLFWLWLIYWRDEYRPEPRWLVIRTFILGMLVVVPVAVVELLLTLPFVLTNIQDFSIQNFNQLSIGGIAYLSFVVAGFTEELFKFLVVRTTVYRSPYFDEPTDGLIYSSATALGFASLENVMYLFQYGWQLILVRAPISTVAHVVFSAMWGYPLAMHKLKKPHSTWLVWLGLLGAMAGHGLFDFLAFAQEGASGVLNIILWVAIAALFVGLVVLFVFLYIRGQKNSPYRNIRAELLIQCQNCLSHVPYYAKFCAYCGYKLDAGRKTSPVFCGQCGAELDRKASYCPSCGSRVIKKQKLSIKIPDLTENNHEEKT